jgi:hypothetical protein
VAVLLGELHGTGSGVVADPPICGGQLLVRVRDIAVVVAIQQRAANRQEAGGERTVSEPVELDAGRPHLRSSANRNLGKNLGHKLDPGVESRSLVAEVFTTL